MPKRMMPAAFCVTTRARDVDSSVPGELSIVIYVRLLSADRLFGLQLSGIVIVGTFVVSHHRNRHADHYGQYHTPTEVVTTTSSTYFVVEVRRIEEWQV